MHKQTEGQVKFSFTTMYSINNVQHQHKGDFVCIILVVAVDKINMMADGRFPHLEGNQGECFATFLG